MPIFDVDRWQEIFQTLSKNKMRTFLTAFGVFWGIFMLIIMLGAGNGLYNGATSNFANRATNSMFLWGRSTSKPYAGFMAGRRVRLRNQDAVAMRDQIPELGYLAPRNQLGGYEDANNVVRGSVTGSFSVNGDYPEFAIISPVRMLEGRFINAEDIASKRKTCVIGNRVRDVLFEKGEEVIGEYIRIQGVYFKVVGLFEPFNKQELEDAETIHIPFTTFQQAFNYGDRISWFAMTSKEGEDVEVLEEKVRALLSSRHKIHPEDTRAFGSFNLQEEFQKFSGLFTGIEFITWFVGTLTLFAGVIGVSNIMLVIVKERTKEIGVRRALGARPASIIVQILLESVTLTSIAGLFGILAGVGLLEGISALISGSADGGFFMSPSVSLEIVLTALTVLVVCGTLAGFIPASRAIKIKPVEALRNE